MQKGESQPLLSSHTQINEHGDVLETFYDEDLKLYYTTNGRGIPTWRAAISAMATVAGIGVLGLAKGVSDAGWIGIPLLIFLGFMANYTAKILLKSLYLQKETVTETYHGLSKVAFGKKGFYTVVFMQNLALFSAGVLFLILSGLSILQLRVSWNVPIHDNEQIWRYVILTGIIILPAILGLKTLKEVSWIAIFGIGATCLAICVIVIMPPLVYSKLDLPKPEHHFVSSGKTFATAFAVMVFAYGGHNVFPALASSLRDTRSYKRFLDGAYVSIVGLYLLPAVVPYVFFGAGVKNPVLETIFEWTSRGPSGYNIPVDIAYVAMILHLWFTIPIINNPVFLWIEEVTNLSSRKHELLFRLAYRFVYMCIQCAIASSLQYFDPIMGIIGATVISGTVFFLPCFIYLKLNWKNIPVYEISWIFIVLLLATVGSVVGLVNSVLELMNQMSKTPGAKNEPDHYSIHDSIFFAILGSITALGAAVLIFSFYIIKRQSTITSI